MEDEGRGWGAGETLAASVSAPRSEVVGRQDQQAKQRGGEPGSARRGAGVRGRLAGGAGARLLAPPVLAAVAAPVVFLGGRVATRAPPRVLGGQVAVEGLAVRVQELEGEGLAAVLGSIRNLYLRQSNYRFPPSV